MKTIYIIIISLFMLCIGACKNYKIYNNAYSPYISSAIRQFHTEFYMFDTFKKQFSYKYQAENYRRIKTGYYLISGKTLLLTNYINTNNIPIKTVAGSSKKILIEVHCSYPTCDTFFRLNLTNGKSLNIKSTDNIIVLNKDDVLCDKAKLSIFPYYKSPYNIDSLSTIEFNPAETDSIFLFINNDYWVTENEIDTFKILKHGHFLKHKKGTTYRDF